MPVAGGTFTGAVAGPAPTVDAHLATKLYVDQNAGGSYSETIIYQFPGTPGADNPGPFNLTQSASNFDQLLFELSVESGATPGVENFYYQQIFSRHQITYGVDRRYLLIGALSGLGGPAATSGDYIIFNTANQFTRHSTGGNQNSLLRIVGINF